MVMVMMMMMEMDPDVPHARLEVFDATGPGSDPKESMETELSGWSIK